MNVFAFAASLSKGSTNRRLIDLIAGRLRARGATVDAPEFRDFDIPLFDPDICERDGLAPGAQAFADRIAAADGLVIASPEYLAEGVGGGAVAAAGVEENEVELLHQSDCVTARGKRPGGRGQGRC